MVEEVERRDHQGVADRAGEDELRNRGERRALDDELLFAVALGLANLHQVVRHEGQTAVGDEGRIRLDLAQVGQPAGAVAGLLEELAAGGDLRCLALDG